MAPRAITSSVSDEADETLLMETSGSFMPIDPLAIHRHWQLLRRPAGLDTRPSSGPHTSTGILVLGALEELRVQFQAPFQARFQPWFALFKHHFH